MLPPTPVISGFSFRSGVTPQEEKSDIMVSEVNFLESASQTVSSLTWAAAMAAPAALEMETQGMWPSPSLICIRKLPAVLL